MPLTGCSGVRQVPICFAADRVGHRSPRHWRRVMGNRGWWRAFFKEHPDGVHKLPNAFMSSGTGGRVKVYCILCLKKQVDKAQEIKRNELAQNRRVTLSSVDEIILQCKLYNTMHRYLS